MDGVSQVVESVCLSGETGGPCALGGLGLDAGAGRHGRARLVGQPLRRRQHVRARAQHAQRVQHRCGTTTYILTPLHRPLLGGRGGREIFKNRSGWSGRQCQSSTD